MTFPMLVIILIIMISSLKYVKVFYKMYQKALSEKMKYPN